MKDLLKPTKAQIKHRNRLWAKALLQNKKKARGTMYKDGGRCCLAVAQDVAAQCGLTDIEQFYDFSDSKVADFFGWNETDPLMALPDNGILNASNINDGGNWEEMVVSNKHFQDKGLPHSKIAECVMNTYVHPSKKKWSFKL